MTVKYQYKRGFVNCRGFFVASTILLLCTIVYYFPLMTNKFTPGGDGWRIFPYIEFVNHADSFFPLWNPYQLGGIPTLASPERFMLLGRMINSDSIYANAYINATFILFIFLFSLSTYALAREIKISFSGSVIVALVFLYSWYLTRTVYCGRINSIFVLFCYNLSYYLYIRYIKNGKIKYLVGVTLVTGWIICSAGYYTIVTYFPAIYLFGKYYYRNESYQRPLVGNQFLEISIIGFIGVLSLSVVLLPMMYYLFADYSATDSLYRLSETLPNIAEFISTFFLIQQEHGKTSSFLFISIFSLPLLTILLINRDKIKNKPILIFLILCLVSIIFLCGKRYPFKIIVEIFEYLPILKQIRWGSVFIYIMTFSVAFLSGFGFDATKYRINIRFQAYIPFLIVTIIVIAFLFIDLVEHMSDSSTYSLKTLIEEGYVLNLIVKNPWRCIVLFMVLSFPYTKLRENHLKVYIVLLVCLQVIFYRINITVPPVANESRLKNIKNLLIDDDFKDFRVLGIKAKDGWTLSPVGMPNIKTLHGFSLYFSNENRWQLEFLLKKDITELRTHWIKEWSDIDNWNENSLKLLNIKYIIKRGNLSEKMKKRWKLIGSDGKYKLYKCRDWESAFRLFFNWEFLPSVQETLSKMREPSYEPFNTLFLNEESKLIQNPKTDVLINDVDLIKFSENDIYLEVNSSKNAILFLPEYYDPGWKVKVNGKKQKVLRVNASFRGVEIPKGDHKVYIYYSSTVVNFGLVISIFTIGFLFVGIFKQGSFNRR